MVKNNRKNAYQEAYTILQELDEEEYSKIPPEVIQALKENRNEEYYYEVDEDTELKYQPMLPETKAVLFNIFRDYLATPEQKEKIRKIKKKESFLKCWNLRILRHRHRLVRILNFVVDVRIRPCLMRDSAT